MELNNNQGRTRTRNNHQEGEEPLDTAIIVVNNPLQQIVF
jgi:hypothetical protein